jgi:hypothetical protein
MTEYQLGSDLSRLVEFLNGAGFTRRDNTDTQGRNYILNGAGTYREGFADLVTYSWEVIVPDRSAIHDIGMYCGFYFDAAGCLLTHTMWE